MDPLNFYTNPDKLDYEKDVDPIGRDMIKQINGTDYLRTTMYCSGHFKDEHEDPWMHKLMNICFVSIDNYKAYLKLEKLVPKLRAVLGWDNVTGGSLYLYVDTDNDNKQYLLSNLIINYETKERRDMVVRIIMDILV